MVLLYNDNSFLNQDEKDDDVEGEDTSGDEDILEEKDDDLSEEEA